MKITEKLAAKKASKIPKDIPILVLEDIESIREELLFALSELGFNGAIDAAGSIAEAKSYLDKKEYSFLLFDWQLPDGSGVKLLNEYQRGRAQNRIPALMCTSKDKVDNILEALRSGAHNYLIKPFTLETLAEKMAYAWDVSMREKKQD